MKLADLIARTIPPGPWEDAENIPWHEPGFSARMLREHLSPHHDRASRRAQRVEQHVRWLHAEVLASVPARILDLACGPGLYTAGLAALGHECVGVDFSPASIAYAREQAGANSRCRYVEGDIRTADYGDGYGLCTFVHGEFNSLRPSDAEAVLRRALTALDPGGRLVVEAHPAAAVERIAASGPRWHTASSGLFSDRPHLVLSETFWNSDEPAAIERFYVVDLETADVETMSTTTRAYSDDEYRALFRDCGFGDFAFVDSLGDAAGAREDGLFAIVATR